MIGLRPHMPTLNENMLRNSDAEMDPVRNYDWAQYNGATVVVDSADAHTGARSVKYTTVTGATRGEGCRAYQHRVVSLGGFQGSCWVKGLVGASVMVGVYSQWAGSTAEHYRTTVALTGVWQ